MTSNERPNSRSNRRSIKADPAKAVAYLRVSTDEQRLGSEAQREAIATWAARSGVEIVAWCTDHGVSGAAPLDERPGLVGALGSVRAHRAGVLAVAKRDRLARDVAIAAALDRALTQCGARVVAADGAGNGDTPADGFLRTILDAAAAYERELIRARTKAALRVKRARGEFTGGAARYGFAADETGRLVPVVAEQAVLERARALRTQGKSLRAIVAALDAVGCRSRAGKPFALRQIARMLAPERVTQTAA